METKKKGRPHGSLSGDTKKILFEFIKKIEKKKCTPKTK